MGEPSGRVLKWSKYIFPLAVMLVLVNIALLTKSGLDPYISDPSDQFLDTDWGYLNQGLDRISSFSDTARWWTGTWCGEVPFWRPLTSYAFWGMRLLWPKEYMLPRQIIHIILHLCFTALGGLLLWRLTRRRWLALMTIWLFAGSRPSMDFLGSARPSAVIGLLTSPKNIPDPLVGIAILVSLLLLADGRWLSALFAAVVSVCFKELGFMTWPLALLILAWKHRENLIVSGRLEYIIGRCRRNCLPVIAWLSVLGLLVIIHFLAVGIGYRVGANSSWYHRALAYLGGPVISNLFEANFVVPIIAILSAFVIIRFRRSSVFLRITGVLLALALGIALDSYLLGTTWDTSMARLLGCRPTDILADIIWLIIAWEARHDWYTVVLGLAACFITAMPAWMAGQVTMHVLYVPSFFMEVAMAAALLQSAKAIAHTFSAKDKVSHASPTTR